MGMMLKESGKGGGLGGGAYGGPRPRVGCARCLKFIPSFFFLPPECSKQDRSSTLISFNQLGAAAANPLVKTSEVH